MIPALYIFGGLVILLCVIWLYSYINTYCRSEIQIQEGTHGPTFDFAFHTGIDRCKIECSFQKECWYQDKEGDINKLFGFSYGHHHQNSIRFGWKPCNKNEGLIEIYAYMYINGVRRSEILDWVPVEQYHIYEAIWSKEFATFRITKPNKTDSLKSLKVTRPEKTWGYRLFPYFGGNLTAPQNMSIRIKKVA